MNPRAQAAGIAGVLAGLGLLAEFILFMASGAQPTTLRHAATALPFLNQHGSIVRAAALLGAANAALAVIFVTGLAARLHAMAPTRAAATLYFGIIGAAGHGLAALAFWVGIPSFTALAAHDPAAATPAWEAFTVVNSVFDGFGNLFLGLSLLAAGWAIAATRAMPAILGWITLVAGAATVVRPIGLDAAFFVSLLLAIAFRIWAGVQLWRSERSE